MLYDVYRVSKFVIEGIEESQAPVFWMFDAIRCQKGYPGNHASATIEQDLQHQLRGWCLVPTVCIVGEFWKAAEGFLCLESNVSSLGRCFFLLQIDLHAGSVKSRESVGDEA